MSNIVFELFAKLGLDSSAYEKGLDDAKSKATSAGGFIGGGLKTAAKVGAAALGAASAAAGAFAVSSVQAGATFDKSMSQVAATMGLTMDEMANQTGKVDLAWGTFSGNLREYAQEMGKNTAFSATEAADALNYMALAGYDVQTSMEMLPNVLNLAAAGNMDLARASDMVTDTQTAFGISLERTSQMVDEMAKAASTGNTSVEQLGDAFLVVGGLAQELNGGIVTLEDGTEVAVDGVQELEIALTAMANAGVKGNEAGTHMRNMLLKLASPTDEGTKALEKMGVAVFDAEGNMRSLANIMGDLDGAMSTMTQSEKLDAISNIFNTRDVAAAEALLNAVGQDWDAIGASILDAEGAAQQMADTQLDNLAGDVTLFQSALEGAKIAVSDQLTPSLREFVQFGTDGLSKITSAFQEGGLSGAMAAFGTVLSDGISMVVAKLPEAINAGMQLLSAVGQGLLDNMPVIVDAAVNIVNQLASGFLSALPAVVDGGMKLIVGLVDGITQSLPTILPMLVEVAAQIAETLANNAPLLLDAGIKLLQGLLDGILKAMPKLIQALPKVIKAAVDAIVAGIPMLIQGAIELVMALVENLPTIIESLVAALPQIIEAVVNGLLEALPLLMDGAIQLMMALVQNLPIIIQTLVEALPTIVQLLCDALVQNLPLLIQAHIQLIMGLVQAMPQIISALIEAIPQIVTSVAQAIVEAAPMILEAVLTIGSYLLETLGTIGGDLINSAGECMSNMIDSIVEWLSQLPTQMAYWAGYAIGQFIAFYRDLPGKVAEHFTTLISNVKAFGENLKTNAINAGKNFFNGLVDNIKTLPDRMMQLGSDLLNAVSNLPDKFKEIGSNIVKGIWNGISGGWDWLVTQVSDLATSLFQGACDALAIESPSKKFAWVGRMVDEGFAKGLDDYAYLVDDAINSVAGSTLDVPVGTMATPNSSSQNDIIRLLQEIASNRNVTVVLEGDADRLFRVIQRESVRNYEITGQPSFA